MLDGADPTAYIEKGRAFGALGLDGRDQRPGPWSRALFLYLPRSAAATFASYASNGLVSVFATVTFGCVEPAGVASYVAIVDLRFA